MIYYQNVTAERIHDTGPHNSQYRLAENELLALFGALRVLVSREDGLARDLLKGLRGARARLLAVTVAVPHPCPVGLL